MDYKLYEVGGHVRDHLLGLDSNDVDYSVEIRGDYKIDNILTLFSNQLKKDGYEVFNIHEKCLTIRARFPKEHEHSGVADFVICRKEAYIDGSRSPYVELGTLHDDLMRRDFTVNAIARDISNGKFIDPYNGMEDLNNKILRTPTDTAVSFTNDPLRIIRALRFHITKNLEFSDELIGTLKTFKSSNFHSVSVERISQELQKMFKYDTYGTLRILNILSEMNYPLYRCLLPKELWLLPTTKK